MPNITTGTTVITMIRNMGIIKMELMENITMELTEQPNVMAMSVTLTKTLEHVLMIQELIIILIVMMITMVTIIMEIMVHIMMVTMGNIQMVMMLIHILIITMIQIVITRAITVVVVVVESNQKVLY